MEDFMSQRGRVRAVFIALCLGLAAGSPSPALAAEAATEAEEPTDEEAAAAEAEAAAIAEARANVTITGAWTRATPGNATNAAVYLRVGNIGTEAERLIGVRAEMAEEVAIHGANMQPLEGMEVPAEDALVFAPNGNHIMLTDLRAPLREGDSFLVQLEFERGGTQTAAVQVLSANAIGPPTPTAAAAGDITSGATEE
jgi:copper(I)-binding protein